MSQQKSDSIVPPHLAIKAMRDNGYKNAAFAIAELMDNSIQAGAKSVELICVEKNQLVNQRNLNRINEIAILDDGKGMTDSVLKIALQFGNGTRLNDPGDGIGKFGMGLPNSSISQAKHVVYIHGQMEWKTLCIRISILMKLRAENLLQYLNR